MGGFSPSWAAVHPIKERDEEWTKHALKDGEGPGLLEGPGWRGSKLVGSRVHTPARM